VIPAVCLSVCLLAGFDLKRCLVLSDYSEMAAVQSAPPLPLPDLSRPPPGFPPGPGFGPAGLPPPLMSLPLKPPQDTELMPSMPYYDLPAGLMAPLVKVL